MALEADSSNMKGFFKKNHRDNIFLKVILIYFRLKIILKKVIFTLLHAINKVDTNY
jgi:hypothetical protein